MVRAGAFERARCAVQAGLTRAAATLAAEGMARLEPRGKLIRPVVGHAVAGDLPDDAFWFAVTAIQLAHEASLVHDDIVDGAARRRGEATVVSRDGVGGALVVGDHLLTTAYRAAARTRSPGFVDAFARAVERTVAGELRQAAVRGERLDPAVQAEIHSGKSGELFACALATATLLSNSADAAAEEALGRRIGVLHQRVDDLFDFLPGAVTGKPALSDFRQRLWTWPLDFLDGVTFETPPSEVVLRLTEVCNGVSPLRRACAQLEAEIADVREALCRRFGPNDVLDALLDGWLRSLRSVSRPTSSFPRGGEAEDVTTGIVESEGATGVALPAIPSDVLGWERTLAAGSRSFRFAARLLPAADRERIAGIYTFCRYTDDLVDEAHGLAPSDVERRLDAWAALARRAFEGERTGVALLDTVMAEAARTGVAFDHVSGLIDGMRMDLRPRRYRDVADLRGYTYRAASVVGLWITESFGVHDADVLERAAQLGHAMQLTNILRDVGEDLRAGRLYLPLSVLDAHGLDEDAVSELARAGRASVAYRGMLEDLMGLADAWYREAFVAIPALPRRIQAPIAVAAHVYRGIHDGIRRNGYENFTRRAHTTRVAKARLALAALTELRRVRRGPFARRRADTHAFSATVRPMLTHQGMRR